MIAKGKSISHSSNAIDYALNKPGAEEIDRGFIVGQTGQEIALEFKNFQDLNGRCHNNTYSFVVSPAVEDGRKLSNGALQKISQDFIRKMELNNNHQFIAIKHTDREHTHLHIMVNRISMDGIAHNDSFISKKAQTVADNIAIERGLIRAKDIQSQKQQQLLTQTKEIKKDIADKIYSVLKEKPQTFNDFKVKCMNKGLEIVETINKAGALQGYRVKCNEYNFKASEIDRKLTLQNLKQRISLNHNLQKITKNNPLNLMYH